MTKAGAFKFVAYVSEIIGFNLSPSTNRSVDYIKRFIVSKFVVLIEFISKKVYLNEN